VSVAESKYWRSGRVPSLTERTLLGPVLSTVMVRSAESVVFPTLSVARATMVYVPSAGWPLQVTE
jgi:hypothetical protein